MRQKGATLIELIVALVLVGFLAAMVVPYFMSGVIHASDPLNAMPTPLGLQNVMAKIISDYENNGTSSYLHNLSTLSTAIGTGNTYIPTGYTLVTNNPNYKFNATDLDYALLVTIKDNASGQKLTYIFTKQL